MFVFEYQLFLYKYSQQSVIIVIFAFVVYDESCVINFMISLKVGQSNLKPSFSSTGPDV